jgi:hypothetical protein
MGWRAPKLGWLLVGASLAGTGLPASAQTASNQPSDTDLEATVAGDFGVSMEFLEFLGEWETGDGQWVDPTDLGSADWPVMPDDPVDTGDEGSGNAQ